MRRETGLLTWQQADGILFQSTPSMRRETGYDNAIQKTDDISIHSLHAEGDRKRKAYHAENKIYFNPLPPCGGRHIQSQDNANDLKEYAFVATHTPHGD